MDDQTSIVHIIQTNLFCILIQVKSGTIFDNLLVTDDEKKAEEVGKELWEVTKVAEKKMKDKQDEEERKVREEEEKKRKEEEGNEQINAK